ncbi:alpha/beta fold hydrolase [Solicola sp. PLA-1-18]|uniref:alpha/beta fold hydrolase n=1 Tax=Solicola sp. PLA-1-18 TaxID=3380532 RepID=UPI003B7F3FD7
MTHIALVHGGGDSGSAFDLLAAELQARGHTTSAVDLPFDRPEADLWALADAVVERTEGADDVLVVAHSWGGFVGPLVCARLGDRATALVMLAAMVPRPGETPGDWWAATGHDADLSGDPIETFYNGVPRSVAEAALAAGRDQLSQTSLEPWPLDTWPDVPTRVLVGRDDRVFPLDFMRRVVRERLGTDPDEIDGGHTMFIADPSGVADRLEGYLAS